MDYPISLITIYFFLFITGFPLLFFCVYEIWSLIKRQVIWDKKRKLMLLNAIIYPFIFILFFLFLIKLFGVNQELSDICNKIVESCNKGIQEGGDPYSHNSMLGIVFMSSFYYFASLVPNILISFIYSVLSSVMLIKYQPETKWWKPFLLSGLLSIIFIFIGFIFRTPIFNWFGI